jgi:hypothetical protein
LLTLHGKQWNNNDIDCSSSSESKKEKPTNQPKPRINSKTFTTPFFSYWKASLFREAS